MDARSGAVLRFLDFATGTSRELARFDTGPHFGLSVTPDRKTIVFALDKPAIRDLVLIENFR